MQRESHAARSLGRRLIWGMTLVAVSVAFSFGFACAVPLAGFAAVVVLTGARGEALGLVLATFLANQLIGFTCLHYPWDAPTLIWGGVLGLVAIAAVFGAGWVCDHLWRARRLLNAVIAFMTAFTIYEGLLFAATAVSGSGFEAYAAPIVGRIFVINFAGFLALLALHRLAIAAGFVELSVARPVPQGSA